MLQFINFLWMSAVMWVLYVDYSKSVVGHIFAMWQSYTVYAQGHIPVM